MGGIIPPIYMPGGGAYGVGTIPPANCGPKLCLFSAIKFFLDSEDFDFDDLESGDLLLDFLPAGLSDSPPSLIISSYMLELPGSFFLSFAEPDFIFEPSSLVSLDSGKKFKADRMSEFYPFAPSLS